MTNLEELKELLRLHIATQAVPQKTFLATLDRVDRDGGNAAGSWVGEWCRLGEQSVARGALLDATQAFNFARFPYVDCGPRRVALERCVSTFERWLAVSNIRVSKRFVTYQGEDIPIYVAGTPSATVPLLLVMGGIVSLKEQWYRILIDGPKLGFAVAVADFPGVGENPLPYDKDAHHYLGAVLDSFDRHPRGLRAFITGISFAGHLALKQAVCDSRIRGLIVTGSPVRRFFTDPNWLEQVPDTTKRTLCHLCGQTSDSLAAALSKLALTENELRALTIPVHAIVSASDEIVPLEDAQLLRHNLPNFATLQLNDVHGGPRFIGAIRKYIAYSLVRMAFPEKRALAGVLRVLVAIEVAKAKLRHPRWLGARAPAPRAFASARVVVGEPSVSQH